MDQAEDSVEVEELQEEAEVVALAVVEEVQFSIN